MDSPQLSSHIYYTGSVSFDLILLGFGTCEWLSSQPLSIRPIYLEALWADLWSSYLFAVAKQSSFIALYSAQAYSVYFPQ